MGLDIVDKLYASFCSKVMGEADEDELAALCYEAQHEISQLREALVTAVGSGCSDDPMVQQHIDTARKVGAPHDPR